VSKQKSNQPFWKYIFSGLRVGFWRRKSGPMSRPANLEQREIVYQNLRFIVFQSLGLPRRVAPRQSHGRYLTVITTVFELGNVSVPPGPNVTVPITLNTAFDVPAAGVTFWVMIMVCGGFAPFLVDPPSAALGLA
jgi:hypothetical protein